MLSSSSFRLLWIYLSHWELSNHMIIFKTTRIFRVFGQKQRKLQSSWLQNHPWMRYSVSTDALYCAYCVLFSSKDSKEKSFSKTPVSDWKNLPLIVKRHESSTQHQGCVVSSSEYLRIMENKSFSIASMISTSYKTNVATNRHVLEKIIEVILLCGRQNIPLRGHVEERSNFMAILHEKAKADNILSDHLAFSAASRAKYTSPDIQNELVELCGTEVLNQVIGACKSASCFAVIADECTDKATKEQMSLCLRFLDVEKNNNVIIREEFVGFRHAESVKGAAISDLIVRFLADLELDINKIRAQCYDGAANMAGKYSGVQARILQLNPEANYIHCKAHALNLALIHSSKDVCVRNMMSTVQEIAFSFDYSAKRLLAFSEELSDNQNVKEQLDKRTKLRTLCETRWSSRADSLFTFLNAFPVVVSSLEALKDDRDEKAAQYVNAILKFDFMIALVVAEHLLSATVALTNYLQKTDINLLDAVQEARIVVQRLDNERTDPNVWTALFEKAVKVGEEFEIPPSTPRRAGRQMHRQNHPINDPSEYWRVSLYLVFLDHLVTEITSRVIKNEGRFSAEYLIPSKLQALTDQTTNSIFETFHVDLGDRQAFDDEVARWKIRWDMVDGQRPQKLLETLNATNKDLYPNIYAILTVLLTMPVSSASSERSFSAMRRIKSYLRATMGDERLSNLSILHIHRARSVNITDIIDKFSVKKNRRFNFV
ncbi:zinc finger MYM-type protein 1-like [Mytilus edulis]|uniref:zinc finger MYM-type protein 1-like n=1 Tax=Mytilus edulis TaxID=6550 RepID=UPI0039EFB9C1